MLCVLYPKESLLVFFCVVKVNACCFSCLKSKKFNKDHKTVDVSDVIQDKEVPSVKGVCVWKHFEEAVKSDDDTIKNTQKGE